MIWVNYGYSSTYFPFVYDEFKYDDFLTGCFQDFDSSTFDPLVFGQSHEVDPCQDVVFGGAGDEDIYQDLAWLAGLAV